jgi:carboxypeptidase Taq
MSASYEALRNHLRELATLKSTLGLLGWDQETMMPPRAAASRADELALLSRLAHERAMADELNDLLSACEQDSALTANPVIGANLREIRLDYERARKLPPEWVAEFSQTTSHALEAWKAARTDSNFATFQPWLEKILDLCRRKADYFGYPSDGEPYDALIDEFEPGMTARAVEATFHPLREALVPLIDEIGGQAAPDNGPAHVEVALEVQQAFNREILERLGFDLTAGRLDVSTHPFSSGVAPGDTRITSRYTLAGVAEALSSTMHEAGHGMYEQGLPKNEHWGEPLSESLGLGIHESQSRLWENQVGRSSEFWRWLEPRLAAATGNAFAAYDAEALYRAANIVRPNLIRVESDEATYNLHVMLRFDLERAMLKGDLAPADLPAAWNDRIKRDLGLDVPDAARGCLQDIHWSMGAVGYFPTYTLGTLYSAQFWDAILVDLPGLPDAIGRGEFSGLLGWLREKIHRRGRQIPATSLCLELTGKPLDHAPFMDYLSGKLGHIYDLAGSPKAR